MRKRVRARVRQPRVLARIQLTDGLSSDQSSSRDGAGGLFRIGTISLVSYLAGAALARRAERNCHPGRRANCSRQGSGLSIRAAERLLASCGSPASKRSWVRTSLLLWIVGAAPAGRALRDSSERPGRADRTHAFAQIRSRRSEGWTLVVLDPVLDLSTPMGRAMAGIAVVFAQLEREMASERTKDGLAIARAKDKHLGGANPIVERDDYPGLHLGPARTRARGELPVESGVHQRRRRKAEVGLHR